MAILSSVYFEELVLQGSGVVNDHLAGYNFIDGMDRPAHIFDDVPNLFIIKIVAFNGDLGVLDLQVYFSNADVDGRYSGECAERIGHYDDVGFHWFECVQYEPAYFSYHGFFYCYLRFFYITMEEFIP